MNIKIQHHGAKDGVKALIVTHVHIDHVGRIPWLLAAGFKGPIICSQPSAKLLPLVLEDAFKLSISRQKHLVEKYLKTIESRIVALPYKQWFTLKDTADNSTKIRLQRAGHILGSAYVEIDVNQTRIVFSGDLGAPHTPLLPAPKPPYKAIYWYSKVHTVIAITKTEQHENSDSKPRLITR